MPASTSTTKNITPAALDKALTAATERIAEQMSDTKFAEIVATAGRLITKYVKEELKID